MCLNCLSVSDYPKTPQEIDLADNPMSKQELNGNQKHSSVSEKGER